jgi:hypothetical protein
VRLASRMGSVGGARLLHGDIAAVPCKHVMRVPRCCICHSNVLPFWDFSDSPLHAVRDYVLFVCGPPVGAPVTTFMRSWGTHAMHELVF